MSSTAELSSAMICAPFFVGKSNHHESTDQHGEGFWSQGRAAVEAWEWNSSEHTGVPFER